MISTARVIAVALATGLASSSWAADTPSFFKVNPRGTYLHVDPQDDVQVPPTLVTLSRFGVKAGEFIALRRRGAMKPGTRLPDTSEDMIAVFRKGGQRLSPGPKYRPLPIVTDPTCTTANLPTDVPEDFYLHSPSDWVIAQVPADADNIAFSSADCYWSDNRDPNQDYGVEITTFAAVLKNAVKFETSSDGIQVTFRPRFEMHLADAAHLGGYDHFNWIQVITDLRIVATGLSLQLTTSRCGLNATSAGVCRALRDKNARLPFPRTLSEPFFIIDPVYGGYKHQTEDFGRPFPVRDNRPWFLDEVFGPEGERSGPTELDTLIIGQSLRLSFEPLIPAELYNAWIFSLAGVKAPQVGDLLLTNGSTIEWFMPAPAGEDVVIHRIASISKDVTDRLQKLGVSLRHVP